MNTGKYPPVSDREGWDDYRLVVMSRLDKQDSMLGAIDSKLTSVLIEQASAKVHAALIQDLTERIGDLEKFKERATVWMGLIAVLGTGLGGIIGTAVTHLLLRHS